MVKLFCQRIFSITLSHFAQWFLQFSVSLLLSADISASVLFPVYWILPGFDFRKILSLRDYILCRLA
ncbi:hypothetical protein Q7M48_00450 [Candidatus Liberibacter asiaticus]|uniref:hypothetical protein n=1 Tax=Liberibacter asiaticus TaxID=34021 RepID=UPI00031633E1|nr:hypothetical protein [Candidatus Liberibacter asiaticus]MBE2996127.1 hypothetical protein [Candidatus Liberibacter asiaticus]MDI1493963.1 hypothetical protein [Candidatus Liberibacter asiaticus]